MKFQGGTGDKLPKWMYQIMEEVDENVVCFLRKHDRAYQAVVSQMAALQKQYPVIQKLLDGEGALSISAKEHDILTEYLQLQFKMENRERVLHYWHGHVHCYVYMEKMRKLADAADHDS